MKGKGFTGVLKKFIQKQVLFFLSYLYTAFLSEIFLFLFWEMCVLGKDIIVFPNPKVISRRKIIAIWMTGLDILSSSSAEVQVTSKQSLHFIHLLG